MPKITVKNGPSFEPASYPVGLLPVEEPAPAAAEPPSPPRTAAKKPAGKKPAGKK